MAREQSQYPADWVRIAEKDLGRVERSLRDFDPEGAAFFLQQALEKFLKAFLLAQGPPAGTVVGKVYVLRVGVLSPQRHKEHEEGFDGFCFVPFVSLWLENQGSFLSRLRAALSLCYK